MQQKEYYPYGYGQHATFTKNQMGPQQNYGYEHDAPFPNNQMPQQQPITQQPAMNTTIVMQQPQGLRDWSSGICSCCNDMKSCCCGLCCCNFYFGCVAARMGENCCVGCCGGLVGFVCGGNVAMRTKMREKHHIQGSICSDCCMMFCCQPCAMCQLEREMNSTGYAAGGCC